MRIAYIADGRSPIARNWIRYFSNQGHETYLVSTYACEPIRGVMGMQVLPVAFSDRKTNRRGQAQDQASARGIKVRTAVRHWLGPLTVPLAARDLKRTLRTLEPDLVHAMRIPFEGMTAALADPQEPLLISTWGNDFTLHAGASPGMAWLTRRAMKRTNAVHADCTRDARFAVRWGMDPGLPSIVLPGSGGVRIGLFHPGDPFELLDGSEFEIFLRGLDPEIPVIVNPRGFRAYVRNDTFFRALAELKDKGTNFVAVCPAMQNVPLAQHWLDKLDLHDQVRLIPKLTQVELAALFRASDLVVSPSEHDGTPNSLLEAIAAGAFPVAGNLESIREWIKDGRNGYLVDPADPHDLALTMQRAIERVELRQTAAELNWALVERRANYEEVMPRAESFYTRIVQRTVEQGAEPERAL